MGPDDPEPQKRDLEILRALYRYRYLTTSQIADQWWPGCHPTRAQVRLRRMHDAGWLDRLRPRTDRGSHEWIYFLARRGFQLGQSYFRGEETYVPREAKWRPRDAVDLDYVWHDLEVNEWILAYRELLGELLEDWLGPAEARVEIRSAYDSELRRHAPPKAGRLCTEHTWAHDLRLGEDVLPVFPDASVLLVEGSGFEAREVLVEYDRTGRPAKNLEKFRRYDTLLTVGWRAAERFRHFAGPKVVIAPVVVVFVCQPGTIEAFMRAADNEVTGQIGGYLSPGRTGHPGRNGMLFCEAHSFTLGNDPHVCRLPSLPPQGRPGTEFEPREAWLPTRALGRAYAAEAAELPF